MLSFGLLSLICALTSGVFGFGANAPPDWTWEKGSFFFFLLLAAVAQWHLLYLSNPKRKRGKQRETPLVIALAHAAG